MVGFILVCLFAFIAYKLLDMLAKVAMTPVVIIASLFIGLYVSNKIIH